MLRTFVQTSLALALIASASQALAATVVVNGFGAGGWRSWDTRDISGVKQLGLVRTHAAFIAVSPPYVGSAAADTQIGKQIVFMGEGETALDAAGATPDSSPTGSLGGLGYVRLDGTSANLGKSDISFVDMGGIAPASDLLAASFFASYRYYTDSNATSRTPGLNIELTGTNASNYVLAFVQTPYTADAWNTATANNSTSLFAVYGPGASGGAVTHTLADWNTDTTWGPILFGPTATIYRYGFNIGSYQRNALIYMDWTETSLLNAGDTIDFQAIPEPSSALLLLAGLLGLGSSGSRRRARRDVEASAAIPGATSAAVDGSGTFDSMNA